MRRKSRVCGEYPKTLYRFFREEKHARKFTEEGKFRVGLVSAYKNIECAVRRDPTEGEGRYQLRGTVTSARISPNQAESVLWSEGDGWQQQHTESLNPIFLLCCSNATADMAAMGNRFGQYVVQIVSPVSLAIEMDHALNGENGTSGPFLICGKHVEYNKGAVIDDGRTAATLTDLSYCQKPATFLDEQEFRFCIIAAGGSLLRGEKPSNYRDIDLGDGRRSYSKIVCHA